MWIPKYLEILKLSFQYFCDSVLSENVFWIILLIWNVWRFASWSRYSLLWQMSPGNDLKEHIFCSGWMQSSYVSMTSFSLIIFCLPFLPITETRVLKSSMIILDLSFQLYQGLLYQFWCSMVKHIHIWVIKPSLILDNIAHLSLVVVLALKSAFPGINRATPAFFGLILA